jgi:chromate reductase
MLIKILALSGSSRRDSLNKRLLEIAAQGAREGGAEITTLELGDLALPIYDQDLEADSGLPAGARRLQALMSEHHALLIATPEHNGGYTALLKNAIDWASRPCEDGSSGLATVAGKAVAVVSASMGPLGGTRSQIALKLVLDKIGMIVIPQAFALGVCHQAFDDEWRLKDANAEMLVRGVGAALHKAASKLS